MKNYDSSGDGLLMKNFLLGGGNSIDNKLYVLDYQDPTYIGFDIKFDFDEKTYMQDINYEKAPGGLLMDGSEINSAVHYLLSINEKNRANLLIEFIKILNIISNEAPWHFQKLSGLDKLYDMNISDGMRVKNDAYITIETLEGIDLKISMLKELYRKVVWDGIYQRWMLPDNMRKFSMIITLSDLRQLKRNINTSLYNNKRDIYNQTDLLSSTNKMITNINTNNYDMTLEEYKKDIEKSSKLMMDNVAGNISNKYLSVNEAIGWLNEQYPQIMFKCSLCEFMLLDEDSMPFADEVSNSDYDDMITQNIKIKVGKVYIDSSSYLLDISLSEDTRNYQSASNSQLDRGDYVDAQKVLENKLKNITNTYVSKMLMGNVYGLSLTNMENTVSNIVEYGKQQINKNTIKMKQKEDLLINGQSEDDFSKAKENDRKNLGNFFNNNYEFSGNPSI